MADTNTGAKKGSIVSTVVGFVKSNGKPLAIGGGIGLGLGIPAGIIIDKLAAGKKKSK